MDKCCQLRKTSRGSKDKELINNRLNRITGQINRIKKMINNDIYCNDVLIQLAAVEKAIRNLSNIILEDHL
ncbi:MAG: metal-sensitive transcriptional regulator [Bacilli bacterium]|nr:metal-sensitive transcriptional regulator [Bacilli bacterium]